MIAKMPKAISMELDDDIYYSDKSVKIGYFDNQSLFQSCASVKRAILTSYGHLTSLGYELSKMNNLPYFEEIFSIVLTLYFNFNLL